MARDRGKKKAPKVERNPRNDQYTRRMLAELLLESRRLPARRAGVTTVYDRLRRQLVHNIENSGPFEPWNDPRHPFLRVTVRGDVLLIRRRRGTTTVPPEPVTAPSPDGATVP